MRKKILLILIVSIFLIWCSNKRWKCIDVTSYDYNRKNDMECIRKDGSFFFTDYEWAKNFENNLLHYTNYQINT